MDSNHTEPTEEVATIENLPSRLSDGGTFLVASPGDSLQHAVCLQIMCRFGRDGDVALVVTTTESATETIDVYDRVCRETDRPSLRLVDTASEQQSVSAPYSETPVVFTPSADDVERLVLALSDLTDHRRRTTQHILVRSLSPFLDAMSADRVSDVLDRITGIRSERGLCLLGVDYTGHDEQTMNRLAEHVDGVLWVTLRSSDEIELEFRPIRTSDGSPNGGDPTDE